MKPRFVIVMLLVLALAVPATMLAQQNSKDEKQIRAVMDELTQGMLKGGPESLAVIDKYIPDDVVRIPGNGLVYTKSQMIDGIKSGKIRNETYVLSDLKITFYGHTALATGVETTTGFMIDHPFDSTCRFVRVFVKRDGVWKSVYYQSTRMPAPAREPLNKNHSVMRSC